MTELSDYLNCQNILKIYFPQGLQRFLDFKNEKLFFIFLKKGIDFSGVFGIIDSRRTTETQTKGNRTMKKRTAVESYNIRITWIDREVTYTNATSGGIASLMADPCIDKVERV